MANRRSFLNRLSAGVAALGAAAAPRPLQAAPVAPQPWRPERHPQDDWLDQVPGRHRFFYDTTTGNGAGDAITFATNFFVANKSGYDLGDEDLAVVICLRHWSTPFAWTDAMWAKYGLGEYHGLKDASGKPYTRNVFHRPTKNDVHLLMQAIQSPTIPMFADFTVALGIENLQKMGTKFLICNNALGGWTGELEARGKGTMAAIDKELRANLLPGVTVVPAMVIAIEQAQTAGIRYNKQ